MALASIGTSGANGSCCAVSRSQGAGASARRCRGGPVVLGRQPRRVGRRRGSRRRRARAPVAATRRPVARWPRASVEVARRGATATRMPRPRTPTPTWTARRPRRVGSRVPCRLVGLHLVHRCLGLGIEDRLGDGVGDRDRPARRGQLDVVDLGPRRGRIDVAGEVLEVGLDRGADAVAVPRRVRLERVGVGAQLLAPGREVEDLGLEPTALALGDAARGGFGFADQRLRLRLRLLDQLTRARLRLVRPRRRRRAARAAACAAASRRLRDSTGAAPRSPLPQPRCGLRAAGTGRPAASCSFCVKLSIVAAARSSRSSTSSRW